MNLNATVLPDPWSTRILVTDQGQDLLKARLPMTPHHPRALTTLLEGLALWSGKSLHAVLVAAGPLGACRADGLYEGMFPDDTSNVTFDIVDPRDHRRLPGPGRFRQLRLLHGRVR